MTGQQPQVVDYAMAESCVDELYAAALSAVTRLERARFVAGLVADAMAACVRRPELLDVAAVVGFLRRVQAADLTAAEVAQARLVLVGVGRAAGGA